MVSLEGQEGSRLGVYQSALFATMRIVITEPELPELPELRCTFRVES